MSRLLQFLGRIATSKKGILLRLKGVCNEILSFQMFSWRDRSQISREILNGKES